MSARVETHTDVLVVGAGPTGLMLANQLVRRGVRVRIIDRHAGPSLQTRALGVQARTLEIYSHLGIVDRALELGKPATGANIWVQCGRAARGPAGCPRFFPMRGTDHWRLRGILPPNLRGRDDLTFEDVIPSVRQEAGSGLSFKACSGYSTYRIHHRRAARFRDRRCFLLGDAAHIHSPVGAQGMNTGLQDAYNLAWKLALVVSGRAGHALLDSYEDERLPVATRLLSTTDRAFSLVVSDGWLAGQFRTRVLAKIMAFAMGMERVQRLAFRTISQIGIRYRASHLSETSPRLPEAAPQAGDRFPWLRLKVLPNGHTDDLCGKLDDTRFSLIVIGQASPPGGVPQFGDLLSIHEVPSDPANDRELARAHIPRPSFYLLRPDGHVGLAGTHLDASAATRYVSERLHLGRNGA